MVTDPISNMIIAIKNGNKAGLKKISLPYSELKFEIGKLLANEGFIESVDRSGKGVKKVIDIVLRYEGKQPRITEVARLSKPSRRVYIGVRDIRPVRQGFGMLVLSTPKGILSDSVARKEHVGGEALFKIW